MPRVVLTCGTRQHQTIEVESGTTLQEVMLSRNPETGNWPAPTICIYEGRPVLRARWTEIVLVDNAVAVFAELPMGGGGGGGGSNPLQMVLQIVVVALAALATWYIGGAGGLAAGGWFAAGSASAYALAGVASAAIMIGGSMLIGALCPPPSVPTNEVPAARAEAASPTYSLNKSSNQARLYQPEPEGFGKLLVTPDVVAQAWGQYIDNEFYLYQVFGCGRGEYVVHEMRFAETVFWRDGKIINEGFNDVKIEFVPEGQPVTLFPDNVEVAPEVSNQELLAPNAGGTWFGPYPSERQPTFSQTSFPSGVL